MPRRKSLRLGMSDEKYELGFAALLRWQSPGRGRSRSTKTTVPLGHDADKATLSEWPAIAHDGRNDLLDATEMGFHGASGRFIRSSRDGFRNQTMLDIRGSASVCHDVQQSRLLAERIARIRQ